MRKLLQLFMALWFGMIFTFPKVLQAQGVNSVETKLEERALLQLRVNTVEEKEIPVVLEGKDVWVRVHDLEEAGLQGFLGKRAVLYGEEHVSLLSLFPSIAFLVNEKELTLEITASPKLFPPTLVKFYQAAPPEIVYTRDSSFFFNYALNTPIPGPLNFLGELGYNRGTKLFNSSLSRDTTGQWNRGLTNYTRDNPKQMVRFQVGDALGQTDELGGGLFLGGVHYGRNFSLNPYFFRYPSTNFRGATLYPTTADVYINNQLVRSTTLSPGLFELENLPVTLGGGVARVILRDVLGHQVEMHQPYYFTTTLLEKGLSDYSYHLGFRRNSIPSASLLDYGPFVFLGDHRVGLSSSLTAGFRLEGMSHLVSGGPTLSAALPFGEIQTGVGASLSNGVPGFAGLFSFSYPGHFVSFGTSIRALSSNYATSSLLTSADRTRFEMDSSLALPISSKISLSVLHNFQNFRDQGKVQRISLTGNITLSSKLNLLILSNRLFQANQASQNQFFVSLNYALGNNTSSAISFDKGAGTGTTNLEINRTLSLGNDYGYRVQKSDGDEHSTNRLLEYQGSYGRYQLGQQALNGQSLSTLNVFGGIAAIGGNWHFTRTLEDAFALARVSGKKGIRVLSSNQEFGRTDAKGELVIPNLLSYYGNKIQIVPSDIPLENTLDKTEIILAPPYRAGAIANFSVVHLKAIVGKIEWVENGKAVIPVYGELSVQAFGKTIESPVGEEGEFYLENLSAGSYPATLSYQGKSCQLILSVPDSKESLTSLGTIQCVR